MRGTVKAARFAASLGSTGGVWGSATTTSGGSTTIVGTTPGFPAISAGAGRGLGWVLAKPTAGHTRAATATPVATVAITLPLIGRVRRLDGCAAPSHCH